MNDRGMYSIGRYREKVLQCIVISNERLDNSEKKYCLALSRSKLQVVIGNSTRKLILVTNRGTPPTLRTSKVFLLVVNSETLQARTNDQFYTFFS